MACCFRICCVLKWSIYFQFFPPQEVEIPQQYNEDHASETLSPEEAQLRREKAEKFRKMIAAQR